MAEDWWMVKGTTLDSLLVERTIRTLIHAENLDQAIEKALQQDVRCNQLQVTPYVEEEK